MQGNQHCNPDNFEKEAQEILPHEKDGLVVAVSTYQHSLSAAFFINFLVFIRLHHQWKGRILLIADPYDVHRVEKWDLFQLQHGSKYMAQKCLKRPLMLVDLLAAMSVLRPYSPSAWQLMLNTLKDRDCIRAAFKMIEKLEESSEKRQWDIDLLNKLCEMLLDEQF